jgi:hypothetical protein
MLASIKRTVCTPAASFVTTAPKKACVHKGAHSHIKPVNDGESHIKSFTPLNLLSKTLMLHPPPTSSDSPNRLWSCSLCNTGTFPSAGARDYHREDCPLRATQTVSITSSIKVDVVRVIRDGQPFWLCECSLPIKQCAKKYSKIAKLERHLKKQPLTWLQNEHNVRQRM